MEPILYRATHGAHVGFDSQAVLAHNLANINTPGFKADLFQAERSHNNESQKSILKDGGAVDFSKGTVIMTGRDLDIAVDGDGWLAVQDSSGREAYTRGGNLQINKVGQLVTSYGQVVLGDGGPISIPPADRIEIAKDGTISIVPMGGSGNELAILDRLKLVDIPRNDVTKNGDGLMQLKPGVKVSTDSKVSILHGALESSNVNAIDQMVRMISAGREFEGHMKLMTTVDENGMKLAQLLQD